MIIEQYVFIFRWSIFLQMPVSGLLDVNHLGSSLPLPTWHLASIDGPLSSIDSTVYHHFSLPYWDLCVPIIGLVKCFAQFGLASLFSPKTYTSRNCSAAAKCKNPVGTGHHQAQKSINIHESRPTWKPRDLPSGEAMKDSRSICGLRYFCIRTNKWRLMS
jgi:hypothetical protein